MSRMMRIAAVCAVAFLLSACDMTVKLHTEVETDGSGTFSIGFDLDKELVEWLRSAEAGGGTATQALGDLGRLTDTLKAKGWTTTRADRDGGISIGASRGFADQARFEATLDELRAALQEFGSTLNLEQDVAPQDKSFVLTLDYAANDSFFRSGTEFDGRFKFDITPQINQAFAEFVHFEISADLPGEIVVKDGDASISGGIVTWRPTFGSDFTYRAESSSLKIASLLGVVIPALILIGLLAAFVLGRKKEEPPTSDVDAELLVLAEGDEDLATRRANVIAEARAARAERTGDPHDATLDADLRVEPASELAAVGAGAGIDDAVTSPYMLGNIEAWSESAEADVAGEAPDPDAPANGSRDV